MMSNWKEKAREELEKMYVGFDEKPNEYNVILYGLQKALTDSMMRFQFVRSKGGVGTKERVELVIRLNEYEIQHLRQERWETVVMDEICSRIIALAYRRLKMQRVYSFTLTTNGLLDLNPPDITVTTEFYTYDEELP